MIYWFIKLDDGRIGYQIMNSEMITVAIVDEKGEPFEGGIEYSYVGAAPRPEWGDRYEFSV